MEISLLCKIFATLWLPHFVFTQVGNPNVTSHESRLIKDIISVHDIRRRPAKNTSAPMFVQMEFFLGRIHEFNEKAGMLTTYGWIVMQWTDEFIFWDPKDYGGISKVIFPAEDIWRPEVVIENSVSDLTDLGRSKGSRLMIFFDGTVAWMAGMKAQTACNPDITLFPYDVGKCNISLSNWIYSGSHIRYKIGPLGVCLVLYKNNSNWDLVSTHSQVDNREILGSQDSYPIVHFVLILKRKPQYFIMNLIVPVLLVSALALVSFWVPTEAGEKLAVVMSSFVTVAVLMLYVSGLLPQDSDHIAYIEIWMLMVTVLTTLSLVLNTISVRIHYHPESSNPPAWSKSMCFFRRSKVATQDVPDVKGSQQLENAETVEPPVRGGDTTWADVARRFDKIMFWFMLCLLVCSTGAFMSKLSSI